MPNLLIRIKDEIIHAIPAVLFFMIALNLINFTEDLMLKPYDIDLITYIDITIGALIIGKIIIIANTFSFVNAFPNRPLIYNITWKIFIYALFTLTYRILEIVIRGYFSFDNSDTVLQILFLRLTSPIFWAVQIWLFLLFTIYVIASEFIHKIGKNKVKQLLFG